MKVKVTEKILNYEGKPALEKQLDGTEKEVVWRDIIFTSLNNFTPDEKPTVEEKQKCFVVTEKCMTEEEPDLSIEERAFILERIGKIVASPLIIGRSKIFFEEVEKK